MISKVDDGVGQVVQALKDRDMLDNSIILFLADNGAPSLGTHANAGSNYPLRGVRSSSFPISTQYIKIFYTDSKNTLPGREQSARWQRSGVHC